MMQYHVLLHAVALCALGSNCPVQTHHTTQTAAQAELLTQAG